MSANLTLSPKGNRAKGSSGLQALGSSFGGIVLVFLSGQIIFLPLVASLPVETTRDRVFISSHTHPTMGPLGRRRRLFVRHLSRTCSTTQGRQLSGASLVSLSTYYTAPGASLDTFDSGGAEVQLSSRHAELFAALVEGAILLKVVAAKGFADLQVYSLRYTKYRGWFMQAINSHPYPAFLSRTNSF